jgi:hypothetical protein
MGNRCAIGGHYTPTRTELLDRSSDAQGAHICVCARGGCEKLAARIQLKKVEEAAASGDFETAN